MVLLCACKCNNTLLQLAAGRPFVRPTPRNHRPSYERRIVADAVLRTRSDSVGNGWGIQRLLVLLYGRRPCYARPSVYECRGRRFVILISLLPTTWKKTKFFIRYFMTRSSLNAARLHVILCIADD